MKRFILLFLILSAAPIFSQVVAITDFTTEEAPVIKSKMPGVTDIFRNAFMKNNMIQLVDRKHHDQIMQELRLQGSGITNPNSAKAAGELLNADYLIFGTVTRFGMTGLIDSSNVVAQIFGNLSKPDIHTVVSVQMIDVETGRIAAANTIDCKNWNDYMLKVEGLAQNFIDKMVLPSGIFNGTWSGIVEHDGYEDTYALTFRPGGRCNLTVTSIDSRNKEKTQTAAGTYTYGGEVLSINVNFRKNNTVSHVQRVEWRVMIVLAASQDSFNIVIPVSSKQGADRMRVTFVKEE
ncbi:MAG: hypothetical protein Pg6C_03970 [Treponemataceae bacterium]|nr:MAG: hypothetical protein Pg6C_03970 [Treponemataceae bacterium]